MRSRIRDKRTDRVLDPITRRALNPINHSIIQSINQSYPASALHGLIARRLRVRRALIQRLSTIPAWMMASGLQRSGMRIVLPHILRGSIVRHVMCSSKTCSRAVVAWHEFIIHGRSGWRIRMARACRVAEQACGVVFACCWSERYGDSRSGGCPDVRMARLSCDWHRHTSWGAVKRFVSVRSSELERCRRWLIG